MLSELIDVNAVKHFRIIDEWSDILSKGSMVVLFDFAYIGCSIFNVYHCLFEKPFCIELVELMFCEHLIQQDLHVKFKINIIF